MARERLKSVAVLFAAVSAAMACGSSGGAGPTSPTPTPTPQVLRGDVTDPTGDAVPVAGLVVSPDLVAGNIQVENGTTLRIAVSLAPGTLNTSSSPSWITVGLDTDRNTATGANDGFYGPDVQAAFMGVDYLVQMVPSLSRANLWRYATPEREELFGNVPLTVNSDGSLEARVPLSMFGNADGRLRFRVMAQSTPDNAPITAPLDLMPNAGLAAGIVQ